MHANYIGLAKHDKTKNTDRIRERAKWMEKTVLSLRLLYSKNSIWAGPYVKLNLEPLFLQKISHHIYFRDKHKSFADTLFSFVKSFDDHYYIFNTYGKKIVHGKNPCQPVCSTVWFPKWT